MKVVLPRPSLAQSHQYPVSDVIWSHSPQGLLFTFGETRKKSRSLMIATCTPYYDHSKYCAYSM